MFKSGKQIKGNVLSRQNIITDKMDFVISGSKSEMHGSASAPTFTPISRVILDQQQTQKKIHFPGSGPAMRDEGTPLLRKKTQPNIKLVPLVFGNLQNQPIYQPKQNQLQESLQINKNIIKKTFEVKPQFNSKSLRPLQLSSIGPLGVNIKNKKDMQHQQLQLPGMASSMVEIKKIEQQKHEKSIQKPQTVVEYQILETKDLINMLTKIITQFEIIIERSCPPNIQPQVTKLLEFRNQIRGVMLKLDTDEQLNPYLIKYIECMKALYEQASFQREYAFYKQKFDKAIAQCEYNIKTKNVSSPIRENTIQ